MISVSSIPGNGLFRDGTKPFYLNQCWLTLTCIRWNTSKRNLLRRCEFSNRIQSQCPFQKLGVWPHSPTELSDMFQVEGNRVGPLILTDGTKWTELTFSIQPETGEEASISDFDAKICVKPIGTWRNKLRWQRPLGRLRLDIDPTRKCLIDIYQF